MLHAHLEIVFQEQSYSSLDSGQSLAWDHFGSVIADPCGIIADICGVIADPCSDWLLQMLQLESAGSDVEWCNSLNIVKHHETHNTVSFMMLNRRSWNREFYEAIPSLIDMAISALGEAIAELA